LVEKEKKMKRAIISTIFTIMFFVIVNAEIHKISKSEIEDTLSYWTEERIAKAVPFETILSEKYFNIPKVVLPNNEKADTEYVRPETLYQENPCNSFF
jgi:hypothetical protein